MIRQLPSMDKRTMDSFLEVTESMYVVYRAVGGSIKESYTCDTQQEVAELRERMEGFAGKFHKLSRAH